MSVSIRQMQAADWPDVSRIYQEGIDTGLATFETQVPMWETWDAAHRVDCRLVAEDAEGGLLAWAALTPISYRYVYRGVAEVTIYVAGAARGRGVGQMLMRALIEAAEGVGIWSLQSVIFRKNATSIALHEKCGFRLVGYRERIAQLDGEWLDTVIMERRSAIVGR